MNFLYLLLSGLHCSVYGVGLSNAGNLIYQDNYLENSDIQFHQISCKTGQSCSQPLSPLMNQENELFSISEDKFYDRRRGEDSFEKYGARKSYISVYPGNRIDGSEEDKYKIANRRSDMVHGYSKILQAQLSLDQDFSSAPKMKLTTYSAPVSVASGLGVHSGPDYPKKPPPTQKKKGSRPSILYPSSWSEEKVSNKRNKRFPLLPERRINKENSKDIQRNIKGKNEYFKQTSRKDRYDPFAFQAPSRTMNVPTTPSNSVYSMNRGITMTEKERTTARSFTKVASKPLSYIDSRYSVQVENFPVVKESRISSTTKTPIIVSYHDIVGQRRVNKFLAKNSAYPTDRRQQFLEDRKTMDQSSSKNNLDTRRNENIRLENYLKNRINNKLPGNSWKTDPTDTLNEETRLSTWTLNEITTPKYFPKEKKKEIAGYQGAINPIFVSLDQAENREIISKIPTPPPRDYFPVSVEEVDPTVRPFYMTTTPSREQELYWENQGPVTSRPWKGFGQIVEDLLEEDSWKQNKFIGNPQFISTRPIVVGPGTSSQDTLDLLNRIVQSDSVNNQVDRSSLQPSPDRVSLQSSPGRLSLQPPPDLMTSYSDRYGWTDDLPPQLQQTFLPQEDDIRNWTSLELAKPVWEEETNSDSHFRKGFVEEIRFDDLSEDEKETFGTWEQALNLIPALSRSAEPRVKEWILLAQSRRLDSERNVPSSVDSEGDRVESAGIGIEVEDRIAQVA